MLKYKKGFTDRNLIYCSVQWWNISVISTKKLGKPPWKASIKYDGAFLILPCPLHCHPLLNPVSPPSSSSFLLCFASPFYPFPLHNPESEQIAAAWETAVAGVILGSCVSHLQISLCPQPVGCYLWLTCTCSSVAENEAGIGRALGGRGQGVRSAGLPSMESTTL